MPNIVQKNLDWLWRLFFYSPAQPAPAFSRVIVPAVDLTYDWPGRRTNLNKDFVSLLLGGTVQQDFGPAEGKAWYVDYWSLYGTTVVGDVASLSLVIGGMFIQIARLNQPTIVGAVPIVESISRDAVEANVVGMRPLYIPFPDSLRFEYTTAAGAVRAFVSRPVLREVSLYQPIRQYP